MGGSIAYILQMMESQRREDRLREEKREEAKEEKQEARRREDRLREEEIQRKRDEREDMHWREQMAMKREELTRQAESMNQTSWNQGRSSSTIPKPKLSMPVFKEGEDIDDFLAIFDSIADQCHLSPEERRVHLTSAVPEKAKRAFRGLRSDSSYGDLQESLRETYNLTTEAYRVKFRDCVKQADETFVAYGARLQRVLQDWKERAKLDLQDLILMEQLCDHVTEGLKIRIREGEPKTFQEAIKIAENFANARRSGNARMPGSKSAGSGRQTSDSKEVKRVNTAPTKVKSASPRKGFRPQRPQSAAAGNKDNQGCFYCNSTDHFKRNCPKFKADQAKADSKSKGKAQGNVAAAFGGET